eukprot:241473_1
MATSHNTVLPYKAHITLEEAQNLRVGDRIDHRDQVWRYVPAIIKEKNGPFLKLHYIGWTNKWDCWCSIEDELHRFATFESISKRSAHRLQYLKIGDFVDLNSPKFPGWRTAQIRRMNPLHFYGQIQVVFSDADKNRLCWTHLDNVEECDIFGTHTQTVSKRGMYHLPIWLETRHTLLNTPDTVKSQSITDIADTVFGGVSHMMDFIVRHSDSSQLQQIQQIVKQNNVKHEQSIKRDTQTLSEAKQETDVEGTDTDIVPKISNITELSKDCIGHVCSYLNRRDIASFKLTAYKNCMVCLEELRKDEVGVLNTNEMFDDQQKRFTDWIAFISQTHLSFTRHLPSTTYSGLFEMWKDVYDVPVENQLLLKIGYNVKQDHMYRPKEIHHLLISQFLPSRFYLLDTRNIVVFGKETEPAQIMASMDGYDIDAAQLICLKWFDIYFQKLIPLQLIMIDANNTTLDRLLRYIKDEFIVTTNQQKIWHRKVMAYVEELNPNQYHNSFRIYRENCDDRSVSEIEAQELANPIMFNDSIPVLIVSLNHNHHALQTSTFATVIDKYRLIK